MSKISSTAVMNRRALGPESLEFFPTPPWATRAFLNEVLMPEAGDVLEQHVVVEPCCGEGHMVRVLAEVFRSVEASDVHDYGRGFGVKDVLDEAEVLARGAWLITNPPFSAAARIVWRAIEQGMGVAVLCRLNWAEGEERYRALFKDNPPALIVQYAERVAMMEGAWDPELSSATAYAWFVWVPVWTLRGNTGTQFRWIAPGARKRWTRKHDFDLARPGEAARRKAAKKAVGAEPESDTPQDLFGGGA